MISIDQQLLVEARVANEQKSQMAAYGLWLFLGIISAHRFYLGRPLSAILQILSYFFIIGFVWWIVDAFLIPGYIDQHRAKLREKMLTQFANQKSTSTV